MLWFDPTPVPSGSLVFVAFDSADELHIATISHVLVVDRRTDLVERHVAIDE